MRRLVFLLVLFGAAAGARAAPTCHGITVSAVAFASYDVYSAAQQSVPGTITYTCPPPLAPTVTIDVGLNAAGGQRNMRLTTGTDLLQYDVYFDAACTQLWAPGVAQAPSASPMTFYACLPPLQDVSVGSYGDTLTVTFNF